MEEMDEYGEEAKRLLYNMSKGIDAHELEIRTLGGIQIDYSYNGLIRCKFLIPNHLADEEGYWHVGAMAVLMDDVAAATVFTVVGHIKVSVNYNISYVSRAKVQEEMEIEGRIVGHRGKLSLAEVRIKKIENGELVALAKQWMASSVAGFVDTTTQSSKL